nr:unnamed protein product [Callosobruchus chinensis]
MDRPAYLFTTLLITSSSKKHSNNCTAVRICIAPTDLFHSTTGVEEISSTVHERILNFFGAERHGASRVDVDALGYSCDRVVMLALVDADNKFIAVDIGSYGREGDAGIYLKSAFGQKILKKEFPIPPPQPLPESPSVPIRSSLGETFKEEILCRSSKPTIMSSSIRFLNKSSFLCTIAALLVSRSLLPSFISEDRYFGKFGNLLGTAFFDNLGYFNITLLICPLGFLLTQLIVTSVGLGSTYIQVLGFVNLYQISNAPDMILVSQALPDLVFVARRVRCKIEIDHTGGLEALVFNTMIVPQEAIDKVFAQHALCHHWQYVRSQPGSCCQFQDFKVDGVFLNFDLAASLSFIIFFISSFNHGAFGLVILDDFIGIKPRLVSKFFNIMVGPWTARIPGIL